MNDVTPKKLTVKDASLDDNKIPRGLILKYGETPYILKAGLEWKANKLFGGAGYSIQIEIIERKEDYVLAKSKLTVLSNNAIFENYGEASFKNVNSLMQKQLLHLAVTRAECRVLRMAIACGYASYDEVMTMSGKDSKEVLLPDGDKPATEEQLETLKSLGETSMIPDKEGKAKGFTKQSAADRIAELATKK